MIDVEGYVFDTVATATRSQFSTASVKGEYEPQQSTFPCVTIEQKDNYIVSSAQTEENTEALVSVMYEVNVYTNNGANKKKDAKKIMAFVDSKMAEIGFRRTMCQPMPNIFDATIYRITARYSAEISARTVGLNTDYTFYSQS